MDPTPESSSPHTGFVLMLVYEFRAEGSRLSVTLGHMKKNIQGANQCKCVVLNLQEKLFLEQRTVCHRNII